jgi:hypothetical protein
MIALLLGLWVAFTPAVFAVPAAAMTVQMSTSNDAGSECCDNCPDTGADRNGCALVCLNVSPFATVAEHDNPSPGVFHMDHRLGRSLALSGRFSPPDPAPPKSVSRL